ncbi:hypothetical protein [Aeromonas veronii]|nr:hypothetical protein [Aeromonas veronii]
MTISNAMNWPSRVALIFMKDPFSWASVKNLYFIALVAIGNR